MFLIETLVFFCSHTLSKPFKKNFFAFFQIVSVANKNAHGWIETTITFSFGHGKQNSMWVRLLNLDFFDCFVNQYMPRVSICSFF